MGTTLTGTTPATTYDSLIKVTDNGPIGTSLKTLTDGLGNDSALALSSRGLKVNTTATLITDTASICHYSNDYLYVRGGAAGLVIGDDGLSTRIAFVDNDYVNFETNSTERMRITSTGNVGIGTSAPTVPLDVVGATALEQFRVGNTTGGTDFGITVIENDAVVFNSAEGATARDLVIQLGGTERARFTANGLTFNGDTTAANALDDYEEGTWTMGVGFGGASVGVTYSRNTGTYTKIGRQVTVNGYVTLTSKGSSTGSARITGLPFSVANAFENYASASFWLASVTFTNQFQGYGNIGANTIDLREITTAGVEGALTDADFAYNSAFMVNFTYFV